MVDGILATARAQMREDGVAALNLNEVARRIGVTTPALYKYFPSKIALYDALFRLGTRLYLEEFQAMNLGESSSGATAIRAALEHQLSFSVRNPELYQLVLQRPVPGFVPSDEGLAEAAQAEGIARATMLRWIERGLIAPTIPPERAFALLAVLAEGIASAHIANEPDLPVGEGRFGSLIPDAASLIELAWKPVKRKPKVRKDAPRRVRGKKGAADK